jgi:hypothetical protein
MDPWPPGGGSGFLTRRTGWVRLPPGPPSFCLRFSLVGVSACQADVGGIVTRLGRHQGVA